MFFILSINNNHLGAFGELVRFRELAYGSRLELLKSLTQESLHDQEAVLSFGVTSLVVKNLLEDVTSDLPNIESTYAGHLEKLVR